MTWGQWEWYWYSQSVQTWQPSCIRCVIMMEHLAMLVSLIHTCWQRLCTLCLTFCVVFRILCNACLSCFESCTLYFESGISYSALYSYLPERETTNFSDWLVPGKSSTNQSILPIIVMLVYNGVAIIGGLCQLVFQYQQTEWRTKNPQFSKCLTYNVYCIHYWIGAQVELVD